MRKILQICFITGIMLMMFVPFLLAHREENRISEDENRYYANFPHVWEDEKLNKGYIPEFEEWLNDNARFRTIFREIRVGILYRIFGVLDLEDVRIGRDGELYGASSEAIDLVQGRNLLSQEELKEYEHLLYKLQQWLENQSVGFYYMTCMDKVTMRRNYYPSEVLQYDTETVGKQVEEYIDKKGRVHNVPIYDTLEKEIFNNIFYQCIDWQHWNDAGMYLGYCNLMKIIQQDYPEISYLSEEDYEIKMISAYRNVYGFEYPVEEKHPLWLIKDENAEKRDIEIYDELYYKEHTHYYENEQGKHRALIINDSFIRMSMKNSLAECFEETLSIDLGNLNKLEWLIEVYRPDIVILECFEGNIDIVLSMLRELDGNKGE